MFENIFSKGPLPLLEKGISFSYQRHNVIVNNLVNATTPGFMAKDLSEKSFQDFMSKAMKDRENRAVKYLEFSDASGVEVSGDSVRFAEMLSSDPGPLSHNGNNVDIDRENAKMAENALYYNVLLQLMDKQFTGLRNAIAERVM